MCLTICEARKNGGKGWCSYASIFRQNAAVNPNLDWSCIQPSLHSSTILDERSQEGTFCIHCCEADY